MNAASIDDYRALARRRLPPFLFEYIDGGSYSEITLRRNVEDLHATFRPSIFPRICSARGVQCRWRWRRSGLVA
jgi:isopentenyl diphosphate isomerase/L-lactate dehydrogenase-like FMN-dependent dehydrogenase